MNFKWLVLGLIVVIEATKERNFIMGMYNHFRRKFAKDYERLLNTDLSPDIKVGTVGQLRLGKKFQEEAFPDLQELGIKDLPLTKPGPPVDEIFVHYGDNENSLSIKASGDPKINALGEASAGFVAKFGKKWSYTLAVKGMRYQALDMTPELLVQLQALVQARKLRPYMEFVVGVWTVESVSWLLALRKAATFTVQSNVDITSIADLDVSWTPKVGAGTVNYLKPHETTNESIPLFFKVARMRRNGRQTGDRFSLAAAPTYAGDAYLYELVSPGDFYSQED